MKTTDDSKKFRVFSTFTGIGGFEVGIRNASPEPVEFVGYSEVDKYAISVYEKHFKGVKNYGDITKINADELADFDCLVGGFPCQAFSIAGRRKGFEDTRGTLFFDLARILRAKQPRLFVFENVKGLLNHDGGRTFRTIVTTIAELGYDCQWQVLNSKDFGVPQNRERIIIVGHLRGTPRPQVFPLRSDNAETSNAVTGKGQIVDLTLRQPHGYRVRKDNRAGTLDANYYKGIANQERPGVLIGTLRTHKDGNGFRETKSGLAPTIPARAREDGSGQPVILQKPRGKNNGNTHEVAPTLTGKSYQDNNHVMVQPVQTPDWQNKKQNGRSIKPAGEPSHTLTAAAPHGVLMQGVIRRLTPKECERLQAFPDNWTEYGVEWYTDSHGLLQQRLKPISDTQRYKTCGNAVTTNVIQAVFERIFA